MNLIDRLEAANTGLIGAVAHHDTIRDTIEFLQKHKSAIELSDKILQAARPLVLNMMQVEEAKEAFK